MPVKKGAVTIFSPELKQKALDVFSENNDIKPNELLDELKDCFPENTAYPQPSTLGRWISQMKNDKFNVGTVREKEEPDEIFKALKSWLKPSDSRVNKIGQTFF